MAPDSSHRESMSDLALLSWIQKFAHHGVLTLDKDLKVRSWNHWMEIHSGKKAEETIGSNIFELFPDLKHRNLVSPFQRALKGEAVVLSTALHHHLLTLPSPLRIESNSSMRQTARIAPLLSEGSVSGLVLIIEDVTQREHQADALRRQQRRDQILSWALAFLLTADAPWKTVRQLFFKIAEHLELDSFLLYSQNPETEGHALYASGGIPTASENDFGNWRVFPSASSDSRAVIILNSIQSRLGPEFAILRKAGFTAAIALPLVAKSKTLGLLCFGTQTREVIQPEESDLLKTIAQYLATAMEREKTNMELRTAQQQLIDHSKLLEQRVQDRTFRLQESVSELEAFTYTVAHDLRQPIRGMSGFCDVLLEDFGPALPQGANLIVKRLKRAATRMEILTRDLLEFSRISRQEIQLEKIALEPIIEEIIATRGPEIGLSISIRSPLHPVMAQRSLLHHIIANLIDNGIKFVEPDTDPKITIWTEITSNPAFGLRPQPLLFSSTKFAPTETLDSARGSIPEKLVRLWITDEGIGIAPEAHERVFAIFERGVTAEIYEGTGMGLAIVAKATQRMGGTCGVESESGKGSRFWIELAAG